MNSINKLANSYAVNHIIGVVIPTYKVRNSILDVVKTIPKNVSYIYIVDDLCPEYSGEFVRENIVDDPRLKLLFHKENKGVGGAVKTGYLSALRDNCTIVVKMDGDGQMDPEMLGALIAPIIKGEADYTKGNRFFDLEEIGQMPSLRIIGNSALSFVTKFSSGYWNIFDPTNGYTAIHIKALQNLNLAKVSDRYFFESDMLFRLNIIRAVVADVYIKARYGSEKSNLSEGVALIEFSYKNIKNFFKRIFYCYYLRDMNVGSFELPMGIISLLFGLTYGGYHWYSSNTQGVNAPAGTAILSALSILMGVQLLLAFLNIDISSTPKKPLQSNWCDKV